MNNKTIFIAGAGGIGEAAAIILANYDKLDCTIYIGDRYENLAVEVAQKVNQAFGSEICHGFMIPDSDSNPEMDTILAKSDIILDCLPGSQAPRLARFARDHKCHYANLTEYVKETDLVTEIAEGAETGFVLQTGLAPGYINILALHLFNKFTNMHKVEVVDRVEMKVGALSKHALEPSFYAFTWSPIGVATEYVKDALVVEDFQTKQVPSLSKTEGILIDGIAYEDDYTSGGAADLPVALAGKTKDLRYKTLRYPGHYAWVRSVMETTPSELDRIEHLKTTMLNTIPVVEDDVVVVFASVKGKDHKGVLRAIQKSIHVYPSRIGTFNLRAIQTTTAAPLCQIAVMLLEGGMQGAIFQSQIDSESFLNGDIVSSVYGRIDI